MTRHHRTIAAGATLLLTMTTAACGGAGAGSDDVVRIYTVSAPPMNERFERAFEEAHPEVDLEFTRGAVDLLAKVDAENASGSSGADIFIYSGQSWFLENEEYLVEGDYDPEWPLYGIDGLAPTIGINPHSYVVWNTDAFPDGFDSWDDVVSPEVQGTIGARENVDVVLAGYMQWLEETNGPEFLPSVADLDPKFYPSAIPLTQAVGSGEIGVGIMSAPAAIKELQDQGAPIDYWLPEDGWAVGFNAAVLEKSQNKAGAQTVMDFFMSPEGQAAFNGDSYGGSPLPDVEGAVDVSDMSVLDATTTTQDVIDEWNSKFTEIFRS